MTTWVILTGGGAAVRGRAKGTRKQVEQWCKDHYQPKGYKIIRDTKKVVSVGGGQ